MDHEGTVRREFSRQAETFAARRTLFGAAHVNGWILDHLPMTPGDRVLDVAGGAGHLARALAAHVREVVVADATPRMLSVGHAGAASEGIANVLFLRANAYELPFVADSFDLAVCRFALHHMTGPSRAVAEMARVVRPGGHVAIIDMVDGGGRHNELERLRDPSHTRTLASDELAAVLTEVTDSLVADGYHDQAMPAEPWLDQAKPDPAAAAAVRKALETELAGGPATGLHPTRADDGALTITQRWRCVLGQLSAGAAGQGTICG